MGMEDPFAGAMDLPAHFHEDRKKMWQTQVDTDSLGPRLAGYRSQLDAHTHFIVQQLADGRAFLTGDKPSWTDIHAMWDPRFLFDFAPAEAERAYGRFPEISEWLARLEGVGQGNRIEMPPGTALDIAKVSSPLPATGIDPHDPIGIVAGTTVSTVSVKRDDEHVGEVAVHFPKIGYSIEPV